MLIIEALLEALGAAFLTIWIFGDTIAQVGKPIINGFISFITNVPATDDQAKAVIFVVLVLMAFVPLLNRLNRKKVVHQQPTTIEKPKRKPELRLTDDGELEEL